MKVQDKAGIGSNVSSEKIGIEFNQLFNAFPDPVLIFDKKKNIYFVNSAWEKCAGHSHKDVIGKNIKFLLDTKTPQNFHKKIDSLMRGKAIRTEAIFIKRKNRTRRQLNSTLFPIRIHNTSFYCMQLSRDVAERSAMEKRLWESEKKYRTLMEDAHDAIFVADVESGILIDANKQAEHLIGRPISKIIGMHQSELHPKTEVRRYKKIFTNYVKKGGGITDMLYVVTSNGKRIPVEISASAFKIGGRKVMQGIFRDITERKRHDDLKNEFLSIIAHELKTPITTLKLLFQTYISKYKQYGSGEITLSHLELADQELDRLTRLINDILDTQRIEMGRLELKLETTDLTNLIQNVILKMRIIAKETEIIFEQPEQIKILTDPNRIEQVLINLIKNAIIHSPKGGKIIISLSKIDSHVQISIKDYGAGIPHLKLPFIFDRFYQVKEHSTRGFGLGLYISREIITQHKGTIWVESRVGKGSTFYFSLPIKKIQ